MAKSIQVENNAVEICHNSTVGCRVGNPTSEFYFDFLLKKMNRNEEYEPIGPIEDAVDDPKDLEIGTDFPMDFDEEECGLNVKQIEVGVLDLSDADALIVKFPQLGMSDDGSEEQIKKMMKEKLGFDGPIIVVGDEIEIAKVTGSV